MIPLRRTKFLDLPAELRYQILLPVLPPRIVISPGECSPLVNLKLVCKRFKTDLDAISNSYDAEYVIREPTHLHCLSQRSGIDEVKNVTLQIFSSLKTSVLLSRDYRIDGSDDTSQLLFAWTKHVNLSRSKFPKRELQKISMDITPVPGYMRERGEQWVAWLANVPAVSNRLWNVQERGVADIFTMLATNRLIAQNVSRYSLHIVGSISSKTQTRIPSLLQEFGNTSEDIETAFHVHYVEDDDVLKWETVLEMVDIFVHHDSNQAPKAPDGVKKKLRKGFERDKRFRSLFTKNVLEDSPWTRNIILNLAQMAAGGPINPGSLDYRWHSSESITYDMLKPVKRAFVHQLTLKLDLISESGVQTTIDGVQYKSVRLSRQVIALM